jgi:hypothetical protein
MSKTIDQITNLKISGRNQRAYEDQWFFVEGLDEPVMLRALLQEITRRLNLSVAPDGSETRLSAGPNVAVTGSGTAASPYVIAASGSSADGSETKVSAGANVTVTGSGTAADPYVIAAGGGTADGSETKLDAGTNITVTGSGTTADPYIINAAVQAPDGSETKLSAGTNVTITGSGTATDPYLIEAANDVADGSETILDAGANITVTGSGTRPDPYIINAISPSIDGAETKLNAGANITISGTGTAADPYTITGQAGGGSAFERDSLSAGALTVEAGRLGGSPSALSNPAPGEYTLAAQAGAHLSTLTVYGNNTTLNASQEMTLRVDNSANGFGRRFLVQLYSAAGALIDQQLTATVHTQSVSGNITTITIPGLNGFGSAGFYVELR